VKVWNAKLTPENRQIFVILAMNLQVVTFHTPVLVKEVIELLRVQPGGRYVDCTVGTGGHATAILEKSSPGGQLLGIDIDPKAIKISQARLQRFGKAVLLVNDSFEHLEVICEDRGFRPVHGILFDLGLSSHQLEDDGRGFSFQRDSPLDMRFSPTEEFTAADIVNTFPESRLDFLLKKYGEESRSHQIARWIRKSRPIETTLQLVRVVEQAVGKERGRIHPATKTFQALRIVVNQELERLETALRQAVNLLGCGGRLAVISYHSLEARLVKGFFQQESRDCICPPNAPVCVCEHKATLRIITKKVVTPLPEEIKANPRSRSAKLRVAERI